MLNRHSSYARARSFARASADAAITGAALTGSLAAGDSDRWSDTDLVLAVRGDLAPALDRWTRWLYDDLGARHHWDLTPGPPAVRVFLLPGWLEIDLTFTPEVRFGPRGPQWQTIFGQPQPLDPFPAPDPQQLAGPALTARLRPMLTELAIPHHHPAAPATDGDT